MKSIQVAYKATNAHPRVKIGEYYLSSNNQHGQYEKEHANFHGWVSMVEQVANGIHVEWKQKFMQLTMIFLLLK